MDTFKHFIITRFNLRFDKASWNNDKNNNTTLSSDWMSYRMDLFRNYCLPSVLNQSCNNFEWHIYLDSNTSSLIKKEFSQLSQNNRLINPIYLDGAKDFQTRYKENILSNVDKTTKYVITSRLDNDDILHSEYVSRIQNEFDFQKHQAINFLKVLMISPKTKSKLHIDYQFSNHYVSLIEELVNGEIKGVYSKKDRQWDVAGEITQIIDKPYVMETINDKNLLNTFRGFPVVKVTSLKEFGLKEKYKNNLLDKDNFKIHKFSWFKYLKYLKLCLTMYKK